MRLGIIRFVPFSVLGRVVRTIGITGIFKHPMLELSHIQAGFPPVKNPCTHTNAVFPYSHDGFTCTFHLQATLGPSGYTQEDPFYFVSLQPILQTVDANHFLG